MKFRMVVEVDLDFDLESDGDIGNEDNDIDSDVVGQSINNHFSDHEWLDGMVDAITEKSGWCLKGLNLRVTDAECID